MDITNKDLKRRILQISYEKKLSHLGSCITAVDIIDEIYSIKKPDEKFVLSSGHAGLALYVVLEKYHKFYEDGRTAESIFDHHGVHPDRCEECHIDCSSGSLGQGLPIAVGMALADRSKNVYCLISDGEAAEGSIAESVRIIKEQDLTNLKVYINQNGWGAYRKIDKFELMGMFWSSDTTREKDIWHFIKTNMDGWPSWLQGQAAHYVTMTENQYKEALECLK